MAEQETARLHAIVEGRVQGVGFRVFVEEKAYALKVFGWVRNCWDGSVEVLAEGERQNLEKLLKALQRGPSASSVYSVQTEWETASGEFTRFSIRLTSG